MTPPLSPAEKAERAEARRFKREQEAMKARIDKAKAADVARLKKDQERARKREETKRKRARNLALAIAARAKVRQQLKAAAAKVLALAAAARAKVRQQLKAAAAKAKAMAALKLQRELERAKAKEERKAQRAAERAAAKLLPRVPKVWPKPADWPFGDLARRAYSALMVDPPWRFVKRSAKGVSKSGDKHYDCMSLDDIKALPVRELCTGDAAILMWTTAPFLEKALEVLRAWGFKYRTAGAWAKQTTTGRHLAFGSGYIFRSAAEFFLVGTRGSPKVQVHNVRNLVIAPRREHSRKPDQVRAAMERMWAGPKAELFARERFHGWDAFGNQMDFFPQLGAAAAPAQGNMIAAA